MVAPLLLLALALAADAAPIAGTEAARQICMSTRPASRAGGNSEQREGFGKRRKALLKERRLAVVPLTGLDAGDPDEKQRKVVLVRREDLRTREGVHLFTAERRFELDATGLPEGEHAIARSVDALRKDPRAALRFTFDLEDVEGNGPCPAGARPGSHPVLTVRVLDVELVDGDGKVVASGRGRDAPEERRPAGGKPAVEVTPATVSGKGPLASQVTARAQERLPALQACFEEALARDATLDGALVFQVEIDGAGKGKLLVSADTVQDEPLATCARAALEQVAWGKGGPSVALVPVHFERR